MMGSFKYGFFGKGRGNTGKCPFKHHKACEVLMENGKGIWGCKADKTLKYAHPRMCHARIPCAPDPAVFLRVVPNVERIPT